MSYCSWLLIIITSNRDGGCEMLPKCWLESYLLLYCCLLKELLAMQASLVYWHYNAVISMSKI